MPDQLQLRGGTTTEHNSFTGVAREVTVDTTKKTLVVHDGSQAGGTPLMKEAGANNAASVILGSGGVNALTIDGSQDITLTGASANVVWDKSDNALEFADNAKAVFGTSSDLEIVHNGTNSVIDNSTGTLFVQANTIRFTGQGNSENIAQFIKNADCKLYYNNVEKFKTSTEGVDIVSGNLTITDNYKARFGASLDLQIYHDGSNSYIDNTGTGYLILKTSGLRINSSDNQEALIHADENGNVELHYDGSKKFETFANGVRATNNGNIKLASDSGKFFMGAGDDAQLFHDGTNLHLLGDGVNATFLRAKSGENSIKLLPDGAVELYHNNSKKFETASTGIKVVAGNLDLEDSQSLRLGNSQDFLIYHNGSNSIINDNGTGDLQLVTNQGAKITLQGGSDTMANFIKDGAVELYYDGSRKLKTNSTGFQVGTTSARFLLDNITSGDGSQDIARIGLNRDNGSTSDRQLWSQVTVAPTVAKFNVFARPANDTGTAANYLEIDAVNNNFDLPRDNQKLRIGGDADLSITHSGSTGVIDNITGDLHIKTTGSGDDIVLISNDDIELQPQAGEAGCKIIGNAGVQLFFDGAAQSKAQTVSSGFAVGGKLFTSRTDTGSTTDYASFKVSFFQQIAASGSHTFQVGSVYAMGTVTTFGSRGPSASNATLATGKIFPIHVRAGATAGLGSQIGSDLGGASGGFSYTVAAASQGITVTNGSSTYAINVFVSFDLTGFVS